MDVVANSRKPTLKHIPMIKALTSILILLLGIIGFYKFMTYDRAYVWSKELEYEVSAVAKVYGFNIDKSEEINVNSIKLPPERAIKVFIQEALSKVHLMNYGQEFGESILLTSDSGNSILRCKGWCLGDHVIGLEIESHNIDEVTLNNLKGDFEKHFDNYKIVWTRCPDRCN
jgi:hypothetical protein